MKQYTRSLALLLALLLTLLLPGCGDRSAGQVLRYDIAAGVRSLDPQHATDAAARMMILNSFEGLFRQLPDGSLSPALAERYERSDDGLRYTFYLRRDGAWQNSGLPRADRETYNGKPVTAHDFVFALGRLFDPSAVSPFAASLYCIENAELIAQRAAPADSLGVRALDDYTLEITLQRPNSLLPELLAASYAMPCNEAFFRSTRARYGLTQQMLLFNGPFTISSWDNQSAITLRQNSRYPARKDPVIARGVNLYIQPESKMIDRFFAGETDACRISYDYYQAALDAGGSCEQFEDTVWVLALNGKKTALSNVEVRRALAHAIDRESFANYLPGNFRLTSALVPPAASVAGHPFREFAGEPNDLLYSPHLAKQNAVSGLEDLAREGHAYEKIPVVEILVPEQGNLPLLAGYVQQGWQRSLSVYTGLKRLPLEELQKRVADGDYEAAILPLSAAYASPEAMLATFHSNTDSFGYQSDAYDALLTETTLSGAENYERYAKAEQQLLYDAPVIPLFFETSYYAMAEGVSGINFSPFLSGVQFKYARKQS